MYRDKFSLDMYTAVNISLKLYEYSDSLGSIALTPSAVPRNEIYRGLLCAS